MTRTCEVELIRQSRWYLLRPTEADEHSRHTHTHTTAERACRTTKCLENFRMAKDEGRRRRRRHRVCEEDFPRRCIPNGVNLAFVVVIVAAAVSQR